LTTIFHGFFLYFNKFISVSLSKNISKVPLDYGAHLWSCLTLKAKRMPIHPSTQNKHQNPLKKQQLHFSKAKERERDFLQSFPRICTIEQYHPTEIFMILNNIKTNKSI